MKAFHSYEIVRLKKIAGICQEGEILDIGYAHWPNPYLPPERTTGLDLSRAINKCSYKTQIVGDALDLSTSIGSKLFENIIAGEFIEHLERPYDFLKSIRPNLSLNGILILSTPNPVGWPCVLFEWLNSNKYFYTKLHKYYFSPRWVKRIIEDSGYELVLAKAVGLWAPYITLPCPLALSYQVIYVARKVD